MPLNKKGIRLLADDLVAHQRRYIQDTFGDVYSCGTVCCLAGFCYAREIGIKEFNRLAKANDIESTSVMDSANIQLGTNVDIGFDIFHRSIFAEIEHWPSDLRKEYESNGPRWRVIAALKGLQRLREDGTIDPNPKAVHTRLPQLKQMLALVENSKKKSNK